MLITYTSHCCTIQTVYYSVVERKTSKIAHAWTFIAHKN